MVAEPVRHMPKRRRQKSFGDHDKFLARVTKTLSYGKYPSSYDRTSLPVTEIAAEIFSKAKGRISLEFIDVREAARISRTASLSPCSLVLAILYLDRLKASNPKYLANVPPSQLFLISLMVGSKFLQDDGQDDEVNNCEWATYLGLTVQDINKAEKEFLSAIDWEVYVSNEDFWNRLEGMERLVGLREGCKRGWFSYTELELLLSSCQLSALTKVIVQISLLCLASYTASVFALLGSTMLVTQIPGIVPSSSMVPRVPPIHNVELPSLPNEPTTFVDMLSYSSVDQLLGNNSDFENDLTSSWSSRSPDISEKTTNYTSTLFQICDSVDISRYIDGTYWKNPELIWQHFEINEPVSSWANGLHRFLLKDALLVSLSG